MAQWLETLLGLQKIDLRIRDLETRLGMLPGEMDSLMKKRARLETVTAAANAAVKKVEMEIKRCESETERLGSENRRLQQQSVMVKTNSEYTAMLNTVASNEKRIGDLEEKILVAMDELDAAKSAAAKSAADNDAALKNARGEFEELIAFADEVKKEIAVLKEKRKSAGYGIDPAAMSRYNSLLASKNGGTPVVAVENGICGSCHLKVTPQTMVLLHNGSVESCDNCQHLIYDPAAGINHD